MDPNETLRLILASTDADEATEHCENLADWLRRGGFAPTVPAGTKSWQGKGYGLYGPHETEYGAWTFAAFARGTWPAYWPLPSVDKVAS